MTFHMFCYVMFFQRLLFVHFTKTWNSQILRISSFPGLEKMVAITYLPTVPSLQYIRIWSAVLAAFPK